MYGIPQIKIVDFCKFNFSKQLTLFIFYLVLSSIYG